MSKNFEAEAPRTVDEKEEVTLVLHGLSAWKRAQDHFEIFEQLGFDAATDFDFINMPLHPTRKGRIANRGYMFINFPDPAVAAKFSKAIHHNPLFRPEAACEKVFCRPAQKQGKAANLSSAKTSRQPTEFCVRTGKVWDVEMRTMEPLEPDPPLPLVGGDAPASKAAKGDKPVTLVLHGLSAWKRAQDYFEIFEQLGFDMATDFDFINMPLHDPRKGRIASKGYMFINCTSPDIAEAFTKAIHHHPLFRPEASCDKVYCQPAQRQGRAANLSAAQTSRQPTEFILRTGKTWEVQASNGAPPLPIAGTAPAQPAMPTKPVAPFAPLDVDAVRQAALFEATQRFLADLHYGACAAY